MPITVFDSTNDATASDRFLEWRAAHRLGFYLNQNPEYGWVLHHAKCGHVPPAGEDLAGNIKVCATATAELRGWLKESGEGQAHRCETCRPPVLPPALSQD